MDAHTTPHSAEKMEKRGSDSFHERTESTGGNTHDGSMKELNAKLANPLHGIPEGELIKNGANFAREHGMPDLAETFSKGALVAQNPMGFENMALLSEEDRHHLKREVTKKWDQVSSISLVIALLRLL